MSLAYRKLNLLIFFLLFTVFASPEQQNQFIYHGFTEAGLHLDGLANIHPNGLLQLTNTTKLQKGHAFYKSLLKLDTNVSFSTSFVFAIYRESDLPHSGHGIAFVISPSMDFRHSVPAEYLGLFNASNNGSPANHVFAVELDTVQNPLFRDIDANHVGINVNGLNSVSAASAMYFSGLIRFPQNYYLTSAFQHLETGSPLPICNIKKQICASIILDCHKMTSKQKNFIKLIY